MIFQVRELRVSSLFLIPTLVPVPIEHFNVDSIIAAKYFFRLCFTALRPVSFDYQNYKLHGTIRSGLSDNNRQRRIIWQDVRSHMVSAIIV